MLTKLEVVGTENMLQHIKPAPADFLLANLLLIILKKPLVPDDMMR